jgi:hypothetical protein
LSVYNYILQPGQNLIDVALQEYGSIDGLLKLCNDNNIAIGQNVNPGTSLIIDSNSVLLKKQVINYRNKGIKPATGDVRIVESEWILANGTWNDLKIWIDTETWKDA